eukprot:6926318-Prymnesium_polylepis.2
MRWARLEHGVQQILKVGRRERLQALAERRLHAKPLRHVNVRRVLHGLSRHVAQAVGRRGDDRVRHDKRDRPAQHLLKLVPQPTVGELVDQPRRRQHARREELRKFLRDLRLALLEEALQRQGTKGRLDDVRLRGLKQELDGDPVCRVSHDGAGHRQRPRLGHDHPRPHLQHAQQEAKVDSALHEELELRVADALEELDENEPIAHKGREHHLAQVETLLDRRLQLANHAAQRPRKQRAHHPRPPLALRRVAPNGVLDGWLQH